MKEKEILIDYLGGYGQRELKKGSRLLESAREDIFIIDNEKRLYSVDVPSETQETSYLVELNVLKTGLIADCNCPAFDQFRQCKHCVAAACYLLDEIFDTTLTSGDLINAGGPKTNFPTSAETISAHGQNSDAQDADPQVIDDQAAETPLLTAPGTSDSRPWIKFQQIENLRSAIDRLSGHYWLNAGQISKIAQIGFDQALLHWTFKYEEKKSTFYPEFTFDRRQTFAHRCSCTAKKIFPMCLHVRVAFEKLFQLHGLQYFDTFKDWTVEKNRLLEPYGLSVGDEEAKAFKFSVTYYGELQMTAPSSFLRSNDKNKLQQIFQSFRPGYKDDLPPAIRLKPVAGTIIDFTTGFVFNNNSQRLRLGFELEPVKVYHKKGRTDIRKLSINQPANLPLLNELDDDLYLLLLQLNDNALQDYLVQGGFQHLRDSSNPFQLLPPAAYTKLRNRYIYLLQQLWPQLSVNTHPTFFIKNGKV